MTMTTTFAEREPSRAEIDATRGPLLLEFGAPWCPHCRAAQPLLAAAFAAHPGVPHVKVEDGPGLPLGRSFGIKLWPSLLFLDDGREVARLVRPQDADAIAAAFKLIDRTP